ncbi:hypothetical protein D3C73_1144560 [compost metagenome]
MKNLKDEIEKDMPKLYDVEYVVIYNPDKWKYSIFYFIEDLSKVKAEKGRIYNVLHISEGK